VNIVSMTFGPVLRKLRKTSGLTQEEIGEKLHISREYVSKLERGEREIKLADAIQWCQATSMPEIAAAILTGIDPSVIMNILDHLPIFLQTIGAAFAQKLVSYISVMFF